MLDEKKGPERGLSFWRESGCGNAAGPRGRSGGVLQAAVMLLIPEGVRSSELVDEAGDGFEVRIADFDRIRKRLRFVRVNLEVELVAGIRGADIELRPLGEVVFIAQRNAEGMHFCRSRNHAADVSVMRLGFTVGDLCLDNAVADRSIGAKRNGVGLEAVGMVEDSVRISFVGEPRLDHGRRNDIS